MTFLTFTSNGGVNTLQIILIVVGIVLLILLIVLGSIVLDKYVLASKRSKKQLKDIEKKYEYYHALLTGQDAQYIQRLDIISRTNLLYSDLHSEYFKRYKEIRDTLDKSIEDLINELTSMIEGNKLKDFKTYLKEHELVINNYENAVNKLNDDLLSVIKPEEDARQSSLNLKEYNREVKAKFNAHEQELQFVSESFDKVFAAIEAKFVDFEALLETAQYEDAQEILPKIDSVLKDLDKMIDILPNLLVEVNIDIPQKLNNLVERYKVLINDGYPLDFLDFDNQIKSLNSILVDVKSQIKNLTVDNIFEDVKQVEDQIEKIEQDINKEVDSKKEFDAKSEEVSLNFINLERDFIKVSNSMDKIRKIYLIDDEHEKLLNEVKSSLDVVSKDKRQLEIYVHSATKTPFSTLISKTIELEKGTNDVITRFAIFKDYINSLRSDSEQCHANIKLKYELLKNDEAILRSFQNDNFLLKFTDSFRRSYQMIDDINNILSTIPINVNEANRLNIELNKSSNAINLEINELKDNKEKTSENVLLINRDRMKFSDVNTLLIQVENLYRNCEYKEAYKMSSDILEKLQSKAGN